MRQDRKAFLKKVMILSWTYRKNHKMSASDAMKAAWAAMRISGELRRNKSLVIYFKKIDGSIRRAVATLNREVLLSKFPHYSTEEYAPKKQTGAGVQKYFDLEKNAWRSFRIENFIGAEAL